MSEQAPERVMQMWEDVKRLHGLSESEINCMMQMATIIKMLGFSAELTVKLLKALTAIWEMILDDGVRHGKQERY